MESEALVHFGMAVAAAHGLQALKRWGSVPWFSANSDRLNRIVAVGFALVNSLGIDFQMNGGLHAGGAIHVTFPALADLIYRAFDATGSFGMQEIYYRNALKPAKTAGTGIEGKLREAVDTAMGRLRPKKNRG